MDWLINFIQIKEVFMNMIIQQLFYVAVRI